MKRITLIASLCLVLGLVVVSANAQEEVGVGVQIPFNFDVAGKMYQSGHYTIFPSSHRIKIADADGKIVALLLANALSVRSVGKKGEIVFHCYGDRCFLAEVWSPTREDGLQLFRSKAEVDLAKGENPQYFALVGEKPARH